MIDINNPKAEIFKCDPKAIKVYIDFLNKEDKHRHTRIFFSSQLDAKMWGINNLDRFNSDMIHLL